MFKFLLPTILIGIAVATFFLFINPTYKGVSELKTQIASYDEALTNSKALENERDKLTKKYNTIDPENLAKLEKLLPDNVDNIRLILEIEKIASPYGMVLKDVQYDSTVKKETSSSVVAGGGVAQSIEDNKNYGTWNLEFSTKGTYTNFLNFIKDLENNLRIVDIASIEFSSDAGVGANPSSVNSYQYTFKIKTYWLKN